MKMLLAAALLLAPTAVQAQEQIIRIWGTPAMLGVAERWAEAYEKQQPGVRFEMSMKGSDSAVHGLVGGVADIALMGRANDIVDDNGFSRPKEYHATRIEIATGALAAPGKSDAIALLVHQDNPLKALTLDQLARVIDCGDQPRPIATWGDLGLKGEWADKPVRIHGYDFSTRTGAWLQDRVAGKDRRMCWDRIAEYDDARRLDGTMAAAADRAGGGGRGDRYALVIANAAQAWGGLKTLAVADGGAPVLPTRASVADRSYPLTRRAFAFVDRAPGKPLAPHVLAFLKFALSPEGQALLSEDKGYLPLDRPTAAAQIKILESEK
jgi:phosphate transport system substrate-binding protein